MKVVDDRIKPRILPLDKIKSGKVFRYDGKYYIKTNKFCMDSRECVDVEDGQVIYYNQDIDVVTLQAELHIMGITDKEEE